MTKWAKIVCCIVAPLGLLFCMVGYAALSTTLTIQGTAQAEMPAVIYIAEISEPTYSSNTTVYSDPICVNFPSTKFTSHIKFGSYSSVRFTVKIVNRTPFTQIFNKLESYNQMEGVEGSFNSANIGARITDLNGTELGPNQGTLTIPSGGSATCIVELSNGSRQVYTRNVLYNFTFVRNTADLTDQAAEKVMDKFEQMLNDQLGEITYTYEDKNGNTVTETIPAKNSFNAMYDEMVIQSNQNRYMGNVGGAPAEDIAIVNALFGEAVIMNVAGQDVPVSVMIKSEDVYGDSAREMALYWTADPLDTPNVSDYYIPVYVAVYTQVTEKDANGQNVTVWRQVGEDFAGRAKQSDYGGNRASTGSFVTNDWISTEVYKNVPIGSKLGPVMNAYE